MSVILFDPLSTDNKTATRNMVYCSACSDYVPIDYEGQLECAQCNPEFGMNHEYDPEVGLHELNFHQHEDDPYE